MLLVKQSFESFSSVNYVIASLKEAIGTSYIPTGDSINELMTSFTKIQLGRSFCEHGYSSQASLSLSFTEESLFIKYSSTSGTSVYIEYNFNNSMEVSSIELSLYLPDDRVKPGRYHYETLTHTLYSNDWLKVDWENKTAEIIIPWELVKFNQDVDFSSLIPNWVIELVSNYTAYFNSDLVNAELQKIGYEQSSIPGFRKSWYNSKLSQYIVFHTRLHPIDNNYYILKEGKNFDFRYGLSYNRLIERITVSSSSLELGKKDN